MVLTPHKHTRRPAIAVRACRATHCATGLFVVILSASCAVLRPGRPASDPGASATISRDEFGVPTIEAADDAAAAYATAYAMAEDGMERIEALYARASGIRSAYYGAVDLPGDEVRLRAGAVAMAQAEAAAEPPERRVVLQAFADGLNAYLRTHPSFAPKQITRYDPWMVVARANDAAFLARLTDRISGKRIEDGELVVAVPPDRADGSPLLLVQSHDEDAYELTLKASGMQRHGMTSLGVPGMKSGFGSGTGYAMLDADLDDVLMRVRISADSTQIFVPSDSIPRAVTLSIDSLSLNTEHGVVRRAIRTMKTADGAIVSIDGDGAWLMRSAMPPRRVVAQRMALAAASDSAAFHAALGTQSDAVAVFIDSSGNIARHGAKEVVRQADGIAFVAPGREPIATELLRGTRTFTLQTLTPVAFDTTVYAARDLDGLFDEWEQVGARNPDRAMAADSALEVLRGWNRTSSMESQAMTLFARYNDELLDAPESQFRRFVALENALRSIRSFPSSPWGRYNAIARPGGAVSLMPTAAAPARHGVMFAYDARSGDEYYVWAADIRAGTGMSVVSFGESGDPASPHWFDQAALFAARSMKPAPGQAVMTPYHPAASH